MNIQFLPIKLPPVHGPAFFYKSTHIALDEKHMGNCSGLMVPTSKILVLAHRLYVAVSMFNCLHSSQK